MAALAGCWDLPVRLSSDDGDDILGNYPDYTAGKHNITVLRQSSTRGGIIQPQRSNYLCWLPINPLSCFDSAAEPEA